MPVTPPDRRSGISTWALRVVGAMGVLCAALVVPAAALYAFWVPSFAEDKVRSQLARVSERLGQEVTFGHLEMIGAERAVLHGVSVARHEALAAQAPGPLLTIPRIEAEIDLSSLLTGKPQIERLTVMAPHVELVRTADGLTDLDALLERLGARKEGQEGGSAGEGRRLPAISVIGGTMQIKDHLAAGAAAPSGGLTELTRGMRSPVEYVRDIEVQAHFEEDLGHGTSIRATAVLEPTAEPMPVTLPREVALELRRDPPGQEGPDDKGWRLEVDMKPALIVSRLPKMPFARASIGGVRVSGPEAISATNVEVTTRGFNAPLLTADAVRVGLLSADGLKIGAVTFQGATFRLETRADKTSNLTDLDALVRQTQARSTLASAAALAQRIAAGRRSRAKVKGDPDEATTDPKSKNIMELLPTDFAAVDSRLIWVHRGSEVRTLTAQDLQMQLTHRVVAQKLEVSMSMKDEGERASQASASLGYGEGLELEARFEAMDVARLMKHVEAPGHEALRRGRISGEVGIIRRNAGGAIRVNADLRGSEVGFFHRKLSQVPVEGLDAGLSGRVAWHPERGDLIIERGRLALEEAATVRFGISLLGMGRGDPKSPLNLREVRLEAAMDDTEAQAVFEAVPFALRNELEGMRFGGTVGFNLAFRIDPLRIAQMQTESDVRLKGFDILAYNPRADVRKLNGAFVHAGVQPETGYKFKVQADGPEWAPLNRINAFVIKALRTNEDGSFYSHKGFSWLQIRATIEQNIREGRVVRGASTVSMQLVKNVFLSHERTASRKLQEALLTFIMEQVERIPKNRILESYLNIVEWGPGVYGIRAAARHYFNKSPGGLDLGESIFLISILPGPRKFHRYKEQGFISEGWWSRMQRLMAVMLEREHITQEEYDEAIERRPSFRRARGEEGSQVEPLDEEDLPFEPSLDEGLELDFDGLP